MERDICETIRERIGQDFDGECHLTEAEAKEIVAAVESLRSELYEARKANLFPVKTYVRKKSGSWWEGFVVGHYSTEQTPDGVCVQLDKPMGPVQIYPAAALATAIRQKGESDE